MNNEPMNNQQDADLARLRRFEPVVRYTRGEKFLPTDVARYVRECSLWAQRPNQSAECLVPEGQLTLEKLAEPHLYGSDAVYFLKFIEPLNIAELAAYRVREGLAALTRRAPKDVFRPGHGRLARVGYGSRFVDALFSLTLFLRGRVPGDTSAAAALAYQKMQAEKERYTYYGRAVRVGGWIALQYWFFYPFNNWRSGFFGVNDHEGDWEMVYVYVAEGPDGELKPQWAAYASHDFSGDDLRRRWDDPEVEKVGDHPVIYAGAGSHASYYARGEYLPEVELPFLAPAIRVVDWIQNFWRNGLRQAGAKVGKKPEFNVFRIPFVDYARGDGVSIGPGQDKEWTPDLLDPPPTWAVEYRGLWGLYARDPIAGENAPAGPVYNRDGSVRRSWYDPLGWAGLDKVPPPAEITATIAQRREQIEERRAELQKSVAEKYAELTALGVEVAAAEGFPHLKKARQTQREQIEALSKEMNALRAELAATDATLEALRLYKDRVQSGDLGPVRAHIKHAHHPASDIGSAMSKLAEVWAALSTGVFMVGFVFIYFTTPARFWPIGLGLLLGVIVFVEAGFRRQLSQLVSSLTIGLALASALVLLFHFFWQIVIVGVLVAGAYIMWDNVRELRG